MKRTEEFLCQWQETAINGRGLIKRGWGGTEQWKDRADWIIIYGCKISLLKWNAMV